jgi:type IV pilus assembly protein PilW
LIVSRLALRPASTRATGYTLVELLVVMAIALFLLGGLLTIVESTRSTFTSQTALAKLQNSEQLAMILMTDVIEQAGYFPDPVSSTLDLSFPTAAALAPAPAFSTDQVIAGTSGGAAPGDTFSVRFVTASNDTVMNCTGGTNTTGANVSYTNTFSVDASGNLDCTLAVNGTVLAPVPLVSGVENLQVWYGVRANPAVSDNNVDTYFTAAQMTASDWPNVTSVKVRITFNNPLAAQGFGGATTNYIESVIGVMARTGVQT